MKPFKSIPLFPKIIYIIVYISELGNQTDFNQQIDAVIRSHSSRLRRLLAEYYHEEVNSSPSGYFIE
jgi:hypothetical protein